MSFFLEYPAVRRLRRQLKRLERCACMAAEDELLRRFCGEAGRLEACMLGLRLGRLRSLCREQGEIRILRFARELLCGGEERLDRERIVQAARAYDRTHQLEMAEIDCLPTALRIAACEALTAVAQEIGSMQAMRSSARRWAEGEGALPRRRDAIFVEQALKICGEEGRRDRRRLLLACCNAERMVEQANQRCAACSLRLDNLSALCSLLDRLDWQRCFAEISIAEMELMEDETYAAMDEASKASLRCCLRELARRLDEHETAVVRCALRLGREKGDTACRYLAEDGGREELRRRLGGRRLRRRIPDPTGRRSTLLLVGGTVSLLALGCLIVDERLLLPCLVPLAWVASTKLAGRLASLLVKPRRLLRLKLDAVPSDARTLVVLPVLISSTARAEEMVRRMEVLGCLEQDPNVDYLLLGDFRDGDAEADDDDGAILAAVRCGVAELNQRSEREKYLYLHRQRSLRTQDGRWMGEGRKRGALTALNALLLGREGAGAAFAAEGAAADRLARAGYRYVLTLDADSRCLPGTLRRLLGTMLHPLNRRYALLQPCIQASLLGKQSRYTELTAGEGGMDGYPADVSDFYQDMTGWGCFSGKGLYEVAAFDAATRGVLPEAEILSHDLIEGILCGTGFAGDICIWDDAPASLGAELDRLHRWTRGDWQLLRVAFSSMKLRAVDRMKLVGNLLRSLFSPALLMLLAGAVWLDAPEAFMLGLAANYIDALLAPLDGRAWRCCTLRLAVLPVTALRMADAILRALWRLLVSRKHLLDWVPAADSHGGGRLLRLPGRVMAILLLSGLLRPYWIPAALALVLLFWLGVDWADDLAAAPIVDREALSADQRRLLGDIAVETWRFFERYVPLDGTGLPPDNVQFDPPAGAAGRTSPTNIGMYLMSCVAAMELGMLSREDMLLRFSATLDSLEQLEKWRGQLYNWYDIDSLAPLRPRYVSAVDSGNLAGALLLCARATEGNLAARMETLVREMRLDALYDGERKLFYIGYDVEAGEMSHAQYDLYASESRILSYTAMMLGQAPVEHWQRLGRPLVRLGKGRGLLSWSGTMFEYLMPELLLPSHPHSLAGVSSRSVLAAQMALGRRMNRPWGVSESGYYAFDLHMNYQYRAFGLQEMALDGSVGQAVAAPYAAALALCIQPEAAAGNLRRMREAGWSGVYGMYEAADYRTEEHAGEPRLVKSAMAHHQGMILCAIANALRENVLAAYFMKNPEARALELLLEERCCKRRLPKRSRRNDKPCRMREDRLGRRMPAADCRMDAQAIYGGGTTLLVSKHGAGFARRGRLLLNRFSGDLSRPDEGLFVRLADAASGREMVLGQSGRAEFEAGCARFFEELDGIGCTLTLAVSPENGAVYQHVALENHGRDLRRLQLTGCFAAALAMDSDMRAHAAFQNLFVETRLQAGAVVFHRRSRDAERAYPEMVYAASKDMGHMQFETDRACLLGRMAALGQAGGQLDMRGSTGFVLDPCGALRCTLELPAGEHREMHFALLAGEGCVDEIAEIQREGAARRAIQLSAARGRAALRHCLPDASLGALAQRAVALIYDGRLKPTDGTPEEPVARESLWRAGISGDLPLILVEAGSDAALMHDAAAIHGYYRSLGIETDLVILCGDGGEYRQPARDMAEQLIASCHLSELRGMPGGVFLLDRDKCDPQALRAVQRSAALRLGCKAGQAGRVASQLRAATAELAAPMGDIWKEMRPVQQEKPAGLSCYNGYGGFAGEEYIICLHGGVLPPAPWSNLLASESAGAVLSERGGGFVWQGSSRSGRLTAFANDTLREGWGWMLYLLDEDRREWARLLPGDVAMTDFTVRFASNRCRWEGRLGDAGFVLEAGCVDAGLCLALEITNHGDRTQQWRLAGMADWLLGVDALDGCLLRTWSSHGACFASGSCGVGVFASDELRCESGCDRLAFLGGGDILHPRGFSRLGQGRSGWTLHLPLRLRAGEQKKCRFLLGMAGDIAGAERLLADFRSGRLACAGAAEGLQVNVPDAGLRLLCNVLLPAQVKHARILGRTGLYQPGGAYGFRDQLQDMLPLIYTDAPRVRNHLLRCAARQFEAGDVMHWWHEPMHGVRTGISDDLLFLPFVAARYVLVTGDRAVLEERAPYLLNVAIPEGREDIYAPMQPSQNEDTLHGHCMRAFHRANRRGVHGLCLMGSGDWNDGMNRVGRLGRGESIWLTMFMAACADAYAEVSPSERDACWLRKLAAELRCAVEEHGWDGGWYLRAYCDDGSVLGGREAQACRIDAISQAWAVLAGLDRQRCSTAMEAAWEALADEQAGIIRLLTPPFTGEKDVGYIAAYPPGIRENGAQYSHAACWLGIAFARMGDAARAHRALKLLLPLNHALNKAQADVYRVEPYVMAGDIYADGMHYGRGGWTWYTGSAAWLLMLVYEILGFEQRGRRVRLNALLGDWQRAGLCLRCGTSSYELLASADASQITLDGMPLDSDALQDGFIEMKDDGRTHRAVFPPRKIPETSLSFGKK